jgi:uncharacterized phage protein gp47/JayE
MAEITDQGYQTKTQNQYFEEEKQRYLNIDPLWNLDPSAPDGVKLATDSEIWSNLDELGQKAYNSKDPNKASGTDLDILAAITGTKRGVGTQSTASVTITGTDSTVILAGSLVESTENGEQWTIDADVTISGATAATVTAVNFGAITASAATITKIVNPQSGWASVTNAAPATAGQNPDTDAELRIERNNGVGLPGQNQIDSTFSAIANVEGVARVSILENDSISPTDPDGLPIHSTAILVEGGDDNEVAEAIYFKRNPGPIQHQTSNPVIVPVISEVTGNTKNIVFNRPDPVDITVVYNITDDGTLPANIEQLIKDATIEYTNGELLDADCGFNQTGFGIGEDVHAGRFYTPANQVIGQYGDSYVTAITVNGGALVAINFEELSRFTDANISVVLS